MLIKQPRLHVPLDSEHMELLSSVAVREHKTVPELAKELLEEALEARQHVLSREADKRDTANIVLAPRENA
jgi:hypothetical protein